MSDKASYEYRVRNIPDEFLASGIPSALQDVYEAGHHDAIIAGAKIAKEADAEVERLRGIVGKLPDTEDGKPVTPGMEVWTARGVGFVVSAIDICNGFGPNIIVDNVPLASFSPPAKCYSTEAAAIAAKEAS